MIFQEYCSNLTLKFMSSIEEPNTDPAHEGRMCLSGENGIRHPCVTQNSFWVELSRKCDRYKCWNSQSVHVALPELIEESVFQSGEQLRSHRQKTCHGLTVPRPPKAKSVKHCPRWQEHSWRTQLHRCWCSGWWQNNNPNWIIPNYSARLV